MRKRLDLLLVERGYFPSREQAQRAIRSGAVFAGGRLADKPGQQVAEETAIEVRAAGAPYVSRGGEKLAGALDRFHLDVRGLVCLDLGASTGGFTDCLLRRGAARVYAVDVGRGQLAWRLRQDPRVVVREGCNARLLKPADLPEPPDLVTIDVSFISLTLILPPAAAVLPAHGTIVALIKPQFEAGREQVGKRGVIRDPAVHEAVLRKVLEAGEASGLHLSGLTFSPLRGPEGNIEFFGWWGREPGPLRAVPEEIPALVAKAHAALAAGATGPRDPSGG